MNLDHIDERSFARGRFLRMIICKRQEQQQQQQLGYVTEGCEEGKGEGGERGEEGGEEIAAGPRTG